jgi:hypothetical protein
MEIWDSGQGDIIMLGSDQPWQSNPKVYGRSFQLEGPRRALASLGLATPEAVLARRIASQRTAFAIPGPGPIQGDNFPILEYTAPRAFYIYVGRIGVSRLKGFDERTWQMDLASAEANNDLAKLDPPTLKKIFSDNRCANSDLQAYLQNRYAQYSAGGVVKPLTWKHHEMPCSFQGTNKLGIYFPAGAATNAITHQLAMAEYVFRTDPGDQAAGKGIENALDAAAGHPSLDADWLPAYYADVGVKASLRASDPSRARAILLRGLQLEPDSDQLHYLERILAREETR